MQSWHTKEIIESFVFAVLLGVIIWDWVYVQVSSDPTKLGWDAYNIIQAIMIIYFSDRLFQTIISKLFDVKMTDELRPKIMTYFLELLVSCIMFPFMVYSLVVVYLVPHATCKVVFTGDLKLLATSCAFQYQWLITTTWVFIIVLYSYEMIMQGKKMRSSLLVHHLSAMSLLFLVLKSPSNSTQLMIGTWQALFALFEQLTFWALFFYRIRPASKYNNLNTHKWNFFFAWTSFGITKICSHIMSMYYYIAYFNTLNLAFQIAFPIFAAAFMFAQVYSTYAQYCVWINIKGKIQKQNQSIESDILILEIEIENAVQQKDKAETEVNDTD